MNYISKAERMKQYYKGLEKASEYHLPDEVLAEVLADQENPELEPIFRESQVLIMNVVTPLHPFVIAVPCFDENGKVCIIDSLYPEADKREWTIPNGFDLENYWCPILCYGPTWQHKPLEDALAHCFVNNLLLNNHIA